MISGLRKWAAFVVLAGLLAAPVVGFSHAVVPHGHTHAADNALHSAIEHGLETSLSRKEFGTAALAPLVAFFALIAISLSSRITKRAAFVSPHTHILRRGIVPYRAFR